MAIGIDELDWDDDDDVTTGSDPDVTSSINISDDDDTTGHYQEEDSTVDNDDDDSQTQEDSDVESRFITSVLRSKGIEDSSKIKFEDEDGSLLERDWNELSDEEKWNILNTEDDVRLEDSNDLDDNEIEFINRLRLSGMTPEEFIAVERQRGVADYVRQSAEQNTPHYTVDDLTDEELYVLDLQARVGDITDDELQEALDRATSNEELFQKEIAGIRNEYKQLEDDKNQRDAALAALKLQEQFNAFANNIVSSIDSFTNVGELDVAMNDEDKLQLYTFITGQNQAGVNYLSQALNDPETLVKMSWFALHGDDIFNSISDYYKGEITRAHRAGYELAKRESQTKSSKSERKVVVNKKPKEEVNRRKSIDDLD